MYFIGIDIGSTAAKVAVLNEDKSVYKEFVIPTGWSSKEAARQIAAALSAYSINVEESDGMPRNCRVVSTGYGREAVFFADKQVTEITCHARGAQALFGQEKAVSVIDVGGQDTKVILVENGMVSDFLMNDKCAAGTGKFIEVMANRLNVELSEVFDLAQKGTPIPISALCTVFAETEVISYIAEGRSREDIACGVIASVANKVATMCRRQRLADKLVLTGGLSANDYFASLLSERLGKPVTASSDGRFAGALGAALTAAKLG
ncbi:MAG: acyl-CoA dehydratase activase [Eubacteriales bacterium]|nr:acyl-CoA dehydratase activase [Eubacteriales bacterium]